MGCLITLREALELADGSPDDAALFLPPGVRALDTRCAILEVNHKDDSESPPLFAQENGLSHALSVPQVQDIVVNVRQQVAELTPEQLLAAFVFYRHRDAFIILVGLDI